MRKLDPRSFLDAEQIVGSQLAADEQLLAGPQHLQVPAALAIDKEDGVVFFEARVQDAQRSDARRGARNRVGRNTAPIAPGD